MVLGFDFMKNFLTFFQYRSSFSKVILVMSNANNLMDLDLVKWTAVATIPGDFLMENQVQRCAVRMLKFTTLLPTNAVKMVVLSDLVTCVNENR